MTVRPGQADEPTQRVRGGSLVSSARTSNATGRRAASCTGRMDRFFSLREPASVTLVLVAGLTAFAGARDTVGRRQRDRRCGAATRPLMSPAPGPERL